LINKPDSRIVDCSGGNDRDWSPLPRQSPVPLPPLACPQPTQLVLFGGEYHNGDRTFCYGRGLPAEAAGTHLRPSLGSSTPLLRGGGAGNPRPRPSSAGLPRVYGVQPAAFIQPAAFGAFPVRPPAATTCTCTTRTRTPGRTSRTPGGRRPGAATRPSPAARGCTCSVGSTPAPPRTASTITGAPRVPG